MPPLVKPIIYQLVLRYFSNTNTANLPDGSLSTNGSGKFDDITPAALSSLRDLGITHLWLTGCLRQATLTDWSSIALPPDDPDVVKGIAGSFYAVRDYFDVCPDYARDPANRLAEFDSLLLRIHAAGMKALIDLVPNHVARGYHSTVRTDLNFGINDNPSLFFHPNNHFFYLPDPPNQKLHLSHPPHWNPPGIHFDNAFPQESPPRATGNNCTSPSPADTDWYETIKLNYGYDFVQKTPHYSPRPRTWDLIDQIISYWQNRGVDGFRCDFAHYIPAEAWSFLITSARSRRPNACFYAEAYPSPNSGDPITDMQQLLDAGFDAVYHDDSYNRLKRIFQSTGSQDDYASSLSSLSQLHRRHYILYLENHDERRIPSPVVQNVWTGDSGFGSPQANYLLAPLQFLATPGPILLLNAQEVAEPGAGSQGFSTDNGRTTVFDYASMPSFTKWVNHHAYDGGQLSPDQKHLRSFYRDLLTLCQHPSIQSDGYWGLKYFNHPTHFPDCPNEIYSFARFADASGRLFLIAANFHPTSTLTTPLRIPPDLAALTHLPPQLTIRLLLDHQGAKDQLILSTSRQLLLDQGFNATLPPQTTQVFLIE